MEQDKPETQASAVTLPLDQIITGDCNDVLAGLPARSVDLVFADPPYNLQLRQELYRPNQTRVDGVDDDWDQFAGGFAEYDAFTRAWLAGCRRVLKDTGTLWVIGSYHNIFRVGTILMDLGFWVLNDVIWRKTNPMPQFRGVRFTNAHETLIWAQPRRGARYTFNYAALKALNDGLQMRSDWELPICGGAERLKVDGVKAHPTQKPEALLTRVLLASSQPGDVVLDPFFGTGTTGAVAKRLGRRWLGIERDAGYAALARARIDAVTPLDAAAQAQTPEPRRRPRLPFGALLEAGLLQPGQRLLFDRRLDRAATLRVDGTLAHGDLTGSIHQLARMLRCAPCNGWDHWWYTDTSTGDLRPIDTLRQRLLAERESPC